MVCTLIADREEHGGGLEGHLCMRPCTLAMHICMNLVSSSPEMSLASASM